MTIGYNPGVKQRHKIGYGWVRDLPDFRDLKFKNRKVAAPTVLPTIVSLRRKMPNYIFDQGQLGSCFVGETLVPLLNGNTRSLKELAEGIEGKEFWVYSQNDYGYMVAAKATASKTGINRELIKVRLDNGETIICTPDHQFMNRDGEYVEARNLQPKESLMPFKKDVNKFGYEMVWDNAKQCWDMTHWMSKTTFKEPPRFEGSYPKFQAMKLGRQVLDAGLNLTETNWNKIRDTYTEKKIYKSGRSTEPTEVKYNRKPKYQTALKQFENKKEFLEACKNYNCKVVSVKKIERRADVYCLTVPEYENFALNSGVFVHNCTANSSCMMWDFVHRTGPYSRLQEYYNTRYVEGTVNQDSGGQIRDAIKCLANCGVAQETLWPYNVDEFTVAPPANVVAAGKTDEITTYMSLNQGQELRECLAEGFPFVIGFMVYDQFESDACASTGIVAMPNSASQPVGGHAVCVIGYDLDFHTNPVFLNSKIPAQYVSNTMYEVRNSWGASWGDSGHFWIPTQYLDNAQLASDPWTIRR